MVAVASPGARRGRVGEGTSPGGPRRAGRPDRRATACGRPSSTASTASAWSTGPGCSTCSPGPVRWASRPSRAARRTAPSSSRPVRRWRPSAPTSAATGLADRAEVVASDAAVVAGPHPARGRPGLADPPYAFDGWSALLDAVDAEVVVRRVGPRRSSSARPSVAPAAGATAVPWSHSGGARALAEESARASGEPVVRVLYPGSFDPLHNGHLEVIEAAAEPLRRGRRHGDGQPAEGLVAVRHARAQGDDRGDHRPPAERHA